MLTFGLTERVLTVNSDRSKLATPGSEVPGKDSPLRTKLD